MIIALPHDTDDIIRHALTELGLKVGKRAKTALTQFVPAGASQSNAADFPSQPTGDDDIPF